MGLTLGDTDRALLERLLQAEPVNSAPFWIDRELGSDPVLSHPGLSNALTADLGALLRLERTGVLIVASRYYGHMESFYLSGDARELLAAASRQARADPLAEAQGEIERLQRLIADRDERRRRTAAQLGRFVGRIVLPLALAIIALIAWAAAGPLAGIGVFIALGVVYAVITTGLGITGLQVAKAAEDWATRKAERHLARWTDPEVE